MIIPTQEFLEVFKKTNGALSVAESIAIINIAAKAPHGEWLEMGVYKGKSAMSAVHSGNGSFFVLIDTEFEKEIDTNEVATNISAAAKRPVKLVFIVGDSTEVLLHSSDMYAYVFSDAGSHQDGLPMAEVKLLEDRIIRGGIICFHDFRSQFVEVEQSYNYLLSTGKYEEIVIPWDEIIKYVDENNLEEGNSSWHHQEIKNPCFVGALKRK